MSRIAQPITATAEQYQELLVMNRSLKMEKRYSQRALVILFSLQNKSPKEIKWNDCLNSSIGRSQR